MSDLSAMIDNLISCGEILAETGRALKKFYSGTEEATPAKPEKKTKKQEPAPCGSTCRKAVFQGRSQRHPGKESKRSRRPLQSRCQSDRSEVRQRRQPYQCGSEGLRGACQRGGRINCCLSMRIFPPPQATDGSPARPAQSCVPASMTAAVHMPSREPMHTHSANTRWRSFWEGVLRIRLRT